MGKQGPCCHCGVTSTPLWRNGPPEKPVLCNACGSRWRTKGTLANYTPLHARTDLDDYEDLRETRIKSISINKSKDRKVPKRKPSQDIGIVGGFAPDFNQGPRKVLDEDASNRSSSGSAISNSESCAQFGSADGSDLTGPAQSVVWDSMVPSRKRTCVGRPKPSPVEKLTRDLYTILHEQQSSCFSVSSEEDLLFESERPMVSVEIGHGSVLIRHPSSIIRDEESEASSLSVEKQYSINEAYSHCLTLPPQRQIKSLVLPSPLVVKSTNPAGEGMQLELLKRDQFQNEKVFVLESHHSPLCDIDLNDIINVEEFRRHFTNQEQQQLLKYLPPSDTTKLPESIKSLFESPQFKESLSFYQRLLAEGVFDLSFPGVKTEDCKALKRLTMSNSSKSQWVGNYHALKNSKNGAGRSLVGMRTNVTASNNSIGAKRLRDSQSQKFSEVRAVKSPQRNIIKATSGNKERMESESSCFSPRSLFALPLDSRSVVLDSLPFVDESSDQDLLLDVPSIGSFALAELLLPTKSFSPQAGASSSLVCPNLVQP